ncbi:MAG: glycoside hydrolase family 9 protein [Terriglobales bacterium]|jgi:hypothetical protein
MADSRRDFLKKVGASGLAFPIQRGLTASAVARSETVCRVNILTNQVGYLTHGGKKFLVESNVYSIKPDFYLRDLSVVGDHRIFHGELEEFQGDFGRYYVGDFSEHTQPGKYALDIYRDALPSDDFLSSDVFSIDDDYGELIKKGIDCFAVQRCGPSTTGYHAPCHLDDGVRLDNGQFLDLVGGWHDACDLLKWSDATLTGMIGLLHIAEKSQDDQLKARIFEEVKWGNLYFLKLQDPEGYYYSYGIGGDAPEEGNHWTDNVRGTSDDRKAATRPGEPHLQHMFIAAQSQLAMLYEGWDAPYAKRSLDAAVRCFNWVRKRESRTYLDLGTGASAGLRLYQLTGDHGYLDYALTMAERFAGLQEMGAGADTLKGYFYGDGSRSKSAMHVGIETLAIIGFCELVDALRSKMDVGRWGRTLALYCDDYLLSMAALNAFGIVPCRVKLEAPQGARSYRGTTYRYFMSIRNPSTQGNSIPGVGEVMYGGNNSNLAGTGIVLCYAGRVLGSEKYRRLAQRMLDWILGLNPFDVCMMNGIGYKHPPLYIAPEFIPRLPTIPGSVMNGIVGDEEDRPDLQPGTWHSCEIWTPHLAQTIWLANELSCDNQH